MFCRGVRVPTEEVRFDTPAALLLRQLQNALPAFQSKEQMTATCEHGYKTILLTVQAHMPVLGFRKGE